MKRDIVVDISAWLFIVLFMYTGISKMLDLERFKWALLKSPLLRPLHHVLAYIIPFSEIGVALLLILSFFRNNQSYRRWGLLGSAILMSTFALYIGYMVEFRTDRPCTCGGIISQMNWHQHMYFNLLFTVVAFVTIKLNNQLIVR